TPHATRTPNSAKDGDRSGDTTRAWVQRDVQQCKERKASRRDHVDRGKGDSARNKPDSREPRDARTRTAESKCGAQEHNRNCQCELQEAHAHNGVPDEKGTKHSGPARTPRRMYRSDQVTKREHETDDVDGKNDTNGCVQRHETAQPCERI